MFFVLVILPAEKEELRMARIYKEIIINAPPQKIFNYLIKPGNLPKIWPGVIEIKNEQLSPSGYYIVEWVYKAAGRDLKGTGEYVDMAQNKYFKIKTKGGINSTISCTVQSRNNDTRVTLTMDYRVPSALLGKLTRRVTLKIDEQETHQILANLRVILEKS